MANFPFELVATTGDKALEKWSELKSAGRGIPVVVGCDDEKHPFENLLIPFDTDRPEGTPPPRSVEEVLKMAEGIRFPADLAAFKEAENRDATRWLMERLGASPDFPLPEIVVTENGKTRTLSREETLAAVLPDRRGPPIGEWPTSTNPSMGLSVAYELLSGLPCPKVQIALIPTDDWTTIPAHLRWGGWNACPRAEYHVAALRTWRDRYGAELVGLSFDTMNLRVKTKPGTREEALALARDQYVYCTDIVDQGVDTLRALAFDLMSNDWWYFWWD